jgi:Domain of unknown function (DUF4157)
LLRRLAEPARDGKTLTLREVSRADVEMEQRFGHDFSRVRVHFGTAAEQSAQDVNAHAYTVGHNMVFGAGRFAPSTQEGRRLIVHELTHVLRQDEASPTIQGSPSSHSRRANSISCTAMSKENCESWRS